MKFAAYERGNQKNFIRDIDAEASADLWRFNHEKQNVTPQQRTRFIVWCYSRWKDNASSSAESRSCCMLR
jgi:hypothetical protein